MATAEEDKKRKEQEEKQRPAEVILLFDTQRPQMQERLEFRGGVEISGFAP